MAIELTSDTEVTLPATNRGLKLHILGGQAVYHEKVAEGVFATKTLDAGIYHSAAPANNNLTFKLTFSGGVSVYYEEI